MTRIPLARAGLYVIISWLFIGCNGGPLNLGTDERSEVIKSKVWRLYSDDIVDTANGQKTYIARALADSCTTLLYFHDKDSLTQVDSCANGAPTISGGFWHFYSENGRLYGFVASVKTLPDDESNKFLYSISSDTMQLEIRPSIMFDSINYLYRQRVKTFISH